MTPAEEQRLVLRAQEGCPRSFDRLLVEYERPIFRHVRRMLKDDDAAYDALQQAFLTVVKSIRRLRQRECFRPWLFGVATRVCLKLLSRRHPEVAEPVEDEPPAATPSPEEVAMANERRDRLLDLVLALSPRVRSVLLLHFYEGLSLTEVATALEISPGTAKSRLAAGLHKLRSFEEVRAHEPDTRTG